MDENTSLINIGELSRPATVLIEKISDAVGGIFKPYQLVRVAKAEAQADRVRAEGQIEISDLQRRAFHRFLNEEGKKQRNIEEITRKALPGLQETSNPAKIEDDWISNFFDKCRLISDDEMQSLWSRVLAGESNSPGTYSKRTVSFLAGLDKREAELFTRLCGFTWEIQEGIQFPAIYDELQDVYPANGLTSQGLRHLASIGLVSTLSECFFDFNPKDWVLTYYDKEVRLDYSGTQKRQFNFGLAVFTALGEELAPICGARSVDGYFEAVLKLWRKWGYL